MKLVSLYDCLPYVITYLPNFDVSNHVHLEFYSLQAVRAKVWKARLASPLFNCKTYASNMERLFWKMWKNYEEGNSPTHVTEL